MQFEHSIVAKFSDIELNAMDTLKAVKIQCADIPNLECINCPFHRGAGLMCIPTLIYDYYENGRRW